MLRTEISEMFKSFNKIFLSLSVRLKEGVGLHPRLSAANSINDKSKYARIFPPGYNAANNGRLVIVNFVQKWRSHAQKAQAQGCPRSVATDVAWPC